MEWAAEKRQAERKQFKDLYLILTGMSTECGIEQLRMTTKALRGKGEIERKSLNKTGTESKNLFPLITFDIISIMRHQAVQQ